MDAEPIWRDYIVTVPASASPLTYYVEADGTEIFRGKAYVKPQDTEIRINLNKICQNYLSQDLSLEEQTQFVHTGPVQSFDIYNAADDTSLGSVWFVYDWSYDPDIVYDGSDVVISRPINGHYASGMYTFCTKWKFTGSIVSNITKTAPLASGYTVSACGRYALYYVNPYSGWDAFLFEGKVEKKDKFKRLQYEKFVDNTGLNYNMSDFAKTTYNTEITDCYALHTGYLTDEQSERFASNLMRANQVYLHDLVEDKIMPVNITDADVTHQEYHNNKRMSCYTVNVELSQTKERL